MSNPAYVHENHGREQYFFAPGTLTALSEFAAGYVRRHGGPVGCVCCPMLGQALHERGVPHVVLDIDERFSHLPSFRAFNLGRPVAQPERFSVIVCDPPFFTVSLSTVFGALRILAGFDFSQPLLISYLARRASALEGTFARFGVRDTGLNAEYLTVQAVDRNRTAWFSNLPNAELTGLPSPNATDA